MYTLSKRASINNKEDNLIAEYAYCSRPTQHCTRRRLCGKEILSPHHEAY